jgi:hypothetical protein
VGFALTRPVIISLIGLAAALLAVILALALGKDDETPAPTASTAVPAVSVAPPAAADRIPSFDVVRIGQGGDAVLAGRAMPKAEVVILDGGVEIGRTIADNRGEWVFVPTTPFAPGARQLTLRAQNPDGTTAQSGEPVVLVVPEHADEPVLAFQANAGGGSKLLLGPPLGQGGISIDIAETGQHDKLFISGRGPIGGKVHVYVDNEFIGAVEIDAEGRWKTAAKTPAKGQAVIRADLVDAKGKPIARVETVFADHGDLKTTGDKMIVVAPGNSLWRIARRLYGTGEAYTVIFQANKGNIKDPDLIYPGQVFQIPKQK